MEKHKKKEKLLTLAKLPKLEKAGWYNTADIATATPPSQPPSPTLLRKVAAEGYQIADRIGKAREELEKSSNPVTRECCMYAGITTDLCYITANGALMVGCCLLGLFPNKKAE